MSLRIFVANYVLVCFITVVPLFIFIITVSICCLKLSFSSSKISRYLRWDAISIWILLRLMVGWIWTFFFLEKSTSWAGLRGSGLKGIFQLKAYLEVKNSSLLRILALSFLSLTIGKRKVSSAKIFALDFNSFGKSLM